MHVLKTSNVSRADSVVCRASTRSILAASELHDVIDSCGSDFKSCPGGVVVVLTAQNAAVTWQPLKRDDRILGLGMNELSVLEDHGDQLFVCSVVQVDRKALESVNAGRLLGFFLAEHT